MFTLVQFNVCELGMSEQDSKCVRDVRGEIVPGQCIEIEILILTYNILYHKINYYWTNIYNKQDTKFYHAVNNEFFK